MASKLKNGSSCAACVRYPETNSDSWILTKVDKKLPGNRYLVRDEFADDPRYETYNVDSSHITPFPSTSNEEYKKGETVLALWHDEGTNEWSTMFYNAEVVDNKTGDPKTVRLRYSQTDFDVEVEKDKIARLPPNFTFTEVIEDEDEKPSTTATEEASEDSAKTTSGKKGKHQKEEASSAAASNQMSAASNNEELSESKTDETADFQDKSKASSSNNVSDDNSASSKTENVQDATSNAPVASSVAEAESLEAKSEGTANEEKTASDSNETTENGVSTANSTQQPTDNSAKSDDQTSPVPEKNKRPKTTSKDSSSSNSSSSTPKLQTPEDRRIYFMFHQPEVQERPKLEYLSNEDFTKLAGPKKELKRMETKEGTPLLDSLSDPELFNQENLLHVTGSGIISVANVEKGDEKSGLAEGRIPCGRLRRIINEWIKNPMDSI
ncbi:hypothetical protein M9Y10_042430 [Tritrichomonas musculus]|uniref:SGF29 C-terminal domain-containing protein n=1 Tax=Tritrichomonas musculus TaxID=1915356 RepID=A0ABR2GNM4_9EUKA